MPPGVRARGGTDRSGSGHVVGSNCRARILEPNDEVVALDRRADLEPAGRAPVAMDDRVRGSLVDGLDEVVEALDRRVGVRGGPPHEGADVGERRSVGVDPDRARRRHHIPTRAQASRAKSAVARFTNSP